MSKILKNNAIFDLKMDPFVKAKIVYRLLLFRGRSAGKQHYLLQILKINIFGNFYLNKATTISLFFFIRKESRSQLQLHSFYQLVNRKNVISLKKYLSVSALLVQIYFCYNLGKIKFGIFFLWDFTQIMIM